MKHLSRILLVVGALAIVGCGGGGESYEVDTSVLEGPFENAPSQVKSEVDQGAAHLRDGDFAAGFNALQRAAEKGDLNEEQRKAIFTIIQQVQQVMASEPDKQSDEAVAAYRELAGTLDPQLRTDGSYGQRQGQQPNQ